MIFRIIARSIIIILSFFSVSVNAATHTQLKAADSLFQAQQYMQALGEYRDVYNEGYFSPSMLLKMAYVEDASGNYDQALYYLDVYYQRSADREVIRQIEELASSNGLSGYRYDDFIYFKILINKYRNYILSGLLILSTILMAFAFRKSKRGEKAYLAAVLQVFVLAMVFGLIYLNMNKQAIIISDKTLLRSGPSAGAEPVEIVSKGHKVTVLNQREVWTKIRWDGKEVFIRNSRLRTI